MTSKEWSGPGWRITIADSALTVTQASGSVTVAAGDAGQLAVRRGWFCRSLNAEDQPLVRLRGISRSGARGLKRTIRHLALVQEITATVAWYQTAADALLKANSEQRWIPVETVAELVATRPAQKLIDKVRAAGTEAELSDTERAALDLLDADLEHVVAITNEMVMAAELVSRKGFFDTIEKSPLTEEQARAVVCFDNRVQLLAAAGSGKTSVMVARAAYAVSRGFVRPERILALAFNRDAAGELQERIGERFAAAGIDSSGVRASTFHSFGLDVIGRATGTKPRVAS